MNNYNEGVSGSGDSVKSDNGWSQSGPLYTPDSAGLTRSATVSLQRVFNEAGPYTVQFDLIRPVPLPSNKIARATAKVIWTVQGNEVVRYINIDKGVTISGVAQGVRIVITDATIDDPGSDGYQYEVTVTVCRGIRVGTRGTPLSPNCIVVAVAQGTPEEVAIPQTGVNAILVLPGTFVVGGVQSDLTYKDLVVRQLDPSGNIFADWKPTGANQWVPVVPGCTIVDLACTRVNGQINVTVLFSVDG